MEWWGFGETFIAAILGSGLTTAGVNIYFQHRFKKQEKQEEDQNVVKYLALKLAFLFEGYAVDCANKLQAHRLAVDAAPHAGKFIEEVPEISPLPLEDAYKLLDQTLLNDIFDFPQRCVMANQNAMSWNDVDERDCYITSLAENTIEMGARAMHIGKRLREKYALDSRPLSHGEFDIEKFLKKELDELREHKERIKKQREDRKN